MITRQVAFPIIAACLLSGCDESVPLNYSTRSEADSESLFARGWLPEIIPQSSRDISMRSDLDLNISNGKFRFDQSDHDEFVSQLERVTSQDENEFLAYSYEDWIFWVAASKDHCRFHMRLSRNKEPSEQGGAPNR